MCVVVMVVREIYSICTPKKEPPVVPCFTSFYLVPGVISDIVLYPHKSHLVVTWLFERVETRTM